MANPLGRSRKYFFPKDPDVPSRTTNKKWLLAYAPPFHVVSEEVILEDLDFLLSLDCEDYYFDDRGYERTDLEGGKWIIFPNDQEEIIERGMTELDYKWQFVKRLVEERGKEVGIQVAKCSTGWEGHLQSRTKNQRGQGVIMCYTRNFKDYREVKTAADAIREAIGIESDLFYKPDFKSVDRVYSLLGSKKVCSYKHTANGALYERDGDGRWIRIL